MQIKEITAETTVSGQYLILENQLRAAKNGSNYLAMKVGDPTGELPVKFWGADEELFNQLAVGRVLQFLEINPKSYRGQIQIDLDSKNKELYRVIPEEEVNYGDFLPQTPVNVSHYWQFVLDTIEGMATDYLKQVLQYFFKDRQFVSEFLRVPAALKRHHVYIGGLLEHTVSVTRLCKEAANYYPLVNRDLLLAGAILHDIGKVKTYKVGKGFEGTTEGKLIGHLVLGIQMVTTAAESVSARLPDSEETQRLKNSLLHLLISHHGIMEWGSPVEPLTIEACILHHLDNLDAQTTKFLAVIANQAPEAEWAAYDPALGRSIYLSNIPKEVI